MSISLAANETNKQWVPRKCLNKSLGTFFVLNASVFLLERKDGCCLVEIFIDTWDLTGSIALDRFSFVIVEDEDDDEEEIICSSLMSCVEKWKRFSNVDRSSVFVSIRFNLQYWLEVFKSCKKQLLHSSRLRAGTRQ